MPAAIARGKLRRSQPLFGGQVLLRNLEGVRFESLALRDIIAARSKQLGSSPIARETGQAEPG